MTTFDSKKALQLTRMIYFSLLTGITLFLAVVLNMSSNLFFRPEFTNPLIPSLAILSCLLLPSGFIFSKKYFSKIDQDSGLERKYPIYQSGLLIRLASCEGVSLFAIVCLLLTDNLFCLIFLLTAILIYIAYYPTPDKIGLAVNLTDTEIEMLK